MMVCFWCLVCQMPNIWYLAHLVRILLMVLISTHHFLFFYLYITINNNLPLKIYFEKCCKNIINIIFLFILFFLPINFIFRIISIFFSFFLFFPLVFLHNMLSIACVYLTQNCHTCELVKQRTEHYKTTCGELHASIYIQF